MGWAYLQQYSLIACNMLGTGTESGGVVIVGGHERMARQYWDTGREYCGEAKAPYPGGRRPAGAVRSPDLLLLFTDTLFPKALRYARSEPGDGMATKLLLAYPVPGFRRGMVCVPGKTPE